MTSNPDNTSENKIDYKNTIRLPQTDFPMKGDLPIKEPKIIEGWKNHSIYQKMSTKNAGKKKFILPDGPPYANGAIHLGHALNKTLKDIIIKYKNMRGFQAVFIPGWDCHGLPIEHKVLKDLQAKKITKNDQEILTLCREEAQKWVNVQREDFKRLGILADWDHPYLTMQPEYEAEEVRELARSFKKGLVYRGVRPVYWNWVLKTALADAEIEYHNHKSPSIYVKFPILDPETLAKLDSPKKPTSMVIWTTTPWTLPSNTGIALHPDFEYSVYDAGQENFVIAKGLKESFEKETGIQLTEGFVFKGEQLDLGKARHPWIDRDSTIVLGLHVSLDAGTGAVHTAPGHGADDFKVGLKYKLAVINPVDDAGLFTDEVPEFKGINIFKANPLIVQKLQESGHILAFKEIEHSYPHCWRSKVPLIFRTTPQWFIGIDLEDSQIRQKTMKAIDSIKFVPQWGENRFRAMIEGRPDWCISRQRLWGVPIPVFTCIATGETLADYDVMMKVADVIETEGGINSFSANDPQKFITAASIEKARKDIGNADFGTQGFKHGRDILDVWYDSGICHAAVQKKREGMGFPADLYLEGSDQHRGWFNTSLLSSMCTNGETPYKALLTHGMTLDSSGRKMSKSLGNVIEPQEVSSKSGAEIIRLWTAYGDYGKDMSCGKNELDRVTETYRRIRNSMRYLLGATSDFNVATDAIAYNSLTWIDKWALSRLAALHKDVTEAYDNYEFYKIYHAINIFFTVDLSSVYMDVLKDRLYTWKADGTARRGSQTVLHYMADNLIRMMAPILSFLAEESYGYLKVDKKADSVFLLDYPEIPAEWANNDLATRFAEYLKVRGDVQKVLEGLRAEKTIGASLEAKVTLHAEGELLKNLQDYTDLREFLIVSAVEIKSGTYKIEAAKADGQKCVRCWVYSNEIGQNSKHPEICPKCIEALT
jgi:isoleucyl-tRNA synthetase